MTTKTPPLAALGFFNAHAPSRVQIRGEHLDDTIRKMEEAADEFNRAVEKAPGDGSDDFGERLRQAVKRKTGANASVSAEGDSDSSFGEKLKKAVQRKTSGPLASTTR